MKIAFISASYFSPSLLRLHRGGTISLKLLAESLVEKGYEVIVLAFDSSKKIEETVSGVRIIHFVHLRGISDIQPTLALQAALAMKQYEGKTDLFHLYNVVPAAGGIYKILGGKHPVVATLNGYGGFCPLGGAMCPNDSDSCHFINRVRCLAKGNEAVQKVASVPYAAAYPVLISLGKRLDKYIALSQAVKQLYAAHGYQKGKIEVIPNFLEERQLGQQRLSASYEREIFNVIYVGELVRGKGIDILIRALSRLMDHYPHFRLIIVGDGPEGKALKKLASNLGVSKQTSFVGRIPHEAVWQYYKAADIYVHPTLAPEPFGRIILEAMQFNLPLVVSNVGGPPEIVGDAGLVFEKGNVDDLAQKLELVYRDEKLRQKLSSNCSKVLRNYDRDKILDRIETFYQKVLDRK